MTNLSQLQGALFDFDGTLAPNLDLPDMRRQVLEFTLRTDVPETVYADRYIVEVIDAAYVWLQHNRPDTASAYRDEAHELITNIELNAARTTSPFPGIPTKLGELRAAGLRLGVVTRNCRAAVLQVFPHLESHIDALHTRDDTAFLKPDPRHLQACLDAIGSRPDETAMIGDGALDMHAGSRLGMYCIGVLSGSANEKTLKKAGAQLVIEDCLALAC